MAPDLSQLSSLERLAVRLGRFANERDLLKRGQQTYLRIIAYPWIKASVRYRTYAEGMGWLGPRFRPERGVLQATNHRSFFDQYAVTLAHYDNGAEAWLRRIYFPVRANFFYETPLGILINLAAAAGAMYPPIFRDRAKSEFNKDSLGRLQRFLASPGTLVGVHPEGTRGKGPDPYELLPAQPGIGQIILQAKPLVVPAFINGLSNDFLADLRANFRRDIRRTRPVVIVFGQPLDYSEFTAEKPRPALYKKCADKLRAAIAQIGERERAIRAACARGEIADDDPNWLCNRVKARQRG